MPRPKGSKNKSTLLKEEQARKALLSTPPDTMLSSENIKVGPSTFISGVTSDDIANRQIINAKQKNLPDPEFDFRLVYNPKDVIFFVAAYPYRPLSAIQLTIRTIYARSMVGVDQDGQCISIGYSDKDNVFSDYEQAKEYCNTQKSIIKQEVSSEA